VGLERVSRSLAGYDTAPTAVRNPTPQNTTNKQAAVCGSWFATKLQTQSARNKNHPIQNKPSITFMFTIALFLFSYGLKSSRDRL